MAPEVTSPPSAAEGAGLLILEDEGEDPVARTALRDCGNEPRYRLRNWDSEPDARLAGRNLKSIGQSRYLGLVQKR